MEENKMPQWLKKAVFYEIYPQSFYDTNGDGIGDINGIILKLDYIKSLGCNAIWINPCFESPFMDAGYDVSNYKKIAQRYGTNEDIYRLFEEAHKKDIRIILDLVPGHTSDQHEWFLKSALPEKNEYTNRFIWTDSAWTAPKDFKIVSGKYDRDANFVVNFFSTQPALNYGFNKITEEWQMPYTHPDCLATREVLKDIIRFWLDKGADGFRVDMADSLVKNDDDKTATGQIWLEVRKMLDQDYPEAAIISEWSYPERALNYGFHSDFYLNHSDNGYYALFRNVEEKTGEQNSFFSKQGKGNISVFTTDYLKKYNGSKDKGYMSFITCNHDTPRMSRYFDETELMLAYAFIFTMPGVPFLYYGDEIGMKFKEKLISKEGGYSRTGTRTPMQWNKDKNLGFSSADKEKLYLPVDVETEAEIDVPNVESQLKDEKSLLNTVKAILGLRNSYEDLQADGEFEIVYAKEKKYPFVYKRGDLTIAVNPSAKSVTAPIKIKGDIVFSIGEAPNFKDNEIEISPQSFFVVK
jgi:glycosidase